ncbi:MAG TPA: hypothetical protein VNT76_08180, partial [Candidatus Binatus sp.]|nr:hypothetical protein [Candidatus Binatus sp.]
EIANLAAQNKRLEKQRDELANYRQMVAENGKISTILDQVQNKVAAIGKAATVAYLAMDAAILGAVAAASPDVFQTFTGSLKLLSAEIGTIFLPMVIQTAYWLQQAAAYVRNLTPETREQILSWAKWAVVGTGVVMVLSKMVPLFTALWTAGKYLMGLNWAMMFNPMVLAAVAATAAIAALGYAMYQLSTQHSAAIAENMAAVQQLQSGNGPMTMAQFEQLSPEIRQRILAAPNRAARDAVINAELERNQQQTTANQAAAAQAPLVQASAQATQTQGITGFADGIIHALTMGIKPHLFGDIIADKAKEPLAEQSRLAAEKARLTALRDRGVGGAGGGPDRPELASTFTAQFTSFEQGWKRIQQEAASRGPLEERMLTIAEQSRDYLRNIDANQKNPLVPLILNND